MKYVFGTLYFVFSIILIIYPLYILKKKFNFVFINDNEKFITLKLLLGAIGFLVFIMLSAPYIINTFPSINLTAAYNLSNWAEYSLFWAMSLVFLICCFTKSKTDKYIIYVLNHVKITLPLMTILMFLLIFLRIIIFGNKFSLFDDNMPIQ